MSTNAVSYLLTSLHREGISLDRLSASVQRLQEDLRIRGRDTGFSGDPLHVTIHAVSVQEIDGFLLEYFVRSSF